MRRENDKVRGKAYDSLKFEGLIYVVEKKIIEITFKKTLMSSESQCLIFILLSSLLPSVILLDIQYSCASIFRHPKKPSIANLFKTFVIEI